MASTSWEGADATEGVSMVVQVTEGGRVVMRFPNSPPFDEKVAEQAAREQAQQAKDPEWKQENTGRWVKETTQITICLWPNSGPTIILSSGHRW